MQRGIVIEVHSKHWVVMTKDGLFIKVPIQDPLVQIGEEVSFSLNQTNHWKWKKYATSAVAAIFALFFLFSTFVENEALAQSYVYVEINPGIEIGLNEKLEVINIRPIDKEAKSLLDKIDWNKQSVKKVVVDYLNQAKNKGYLHKKDNIVLSAINEKGSSSGTLRSLRQVIDQDPKIGKKELDLHVFTLPLPKEVKQEAENKGLTPGKYGVWLLSKNSGKEIPVNQISNTPISELTDDMSMLDHPPSEKEWTEIVNKEGGKDQTPVEPSTKESNPKQSSQPNQSNTDKKQTNKKELNTDRKHQSPSTEQQKEDSSTNNPADNETQSKTDETEKKTPIEGSSTGSAGDSDSQTNHIAP